MPVSEYENLYDYVNKNLSPILPKGIVDQEAWQKKNWTRINETLKGLKNYLIRNNHDKRADEVVDEVDGAYEEFLEENSDRWNHEENPA